MRAARAIPWIAVALGASAVVSCARSSVERSSMTADLSSALSSTEPTGGTEAPAQSPGLDAGSPIQPPLDPIDLDAGIGVPPIDLDAGDWRPQPM